MSETAPETTPEPTEVLTAFFVVVEANGTVGVYTNELPAVTVTREANLADLETYASQVSNEAGRLLAAQTLIRALTPAEPETPSDRVADALARRSEEE